MFCQEGMILPISEMLGQQHPLPDDIPVLNRCVDVLLEALGQNGISYDFLGKHECSNGKKQLIGIRRLVIKMMLAAAAKLLQSCLTL